MIFDFNEPMSVVQVVVTTPGGGVGPTMGDFHHSPAAGQPFKKLGKAKFQDQQGDQQVALQMQTRGLAANLLQCNWSPPAGGGAAVVNKVTIFACRR